ncbi:MAG: tetratricopeptide repeat protein [Candidatus Riflebacteria bacterium]
MFISKFRIIFLILLVTLSVAGFADEEAIKKGRALQREKKFEEALQVYKDAIKKTPTEDLFIESGSLLGKMQKYENAQTILEKGLQTYPDSKSLKNLLALILIRKGDAAKGKEMLEEVLKADPNNSFAKSWIEKVNKGETAEEPESDEGKPAGEKPASAGTGSSPTAGSGAFTVDSSLSEAEQQELAKNLYKEMMELEKWELDSFKELHRKVIEKCPLTANAEESCWRLSNLYMLGEDPPDFESVISVLEHLLKQYPDTPLFPDAKNRLLIACQQTKQMDKVVAIYEELFTRDPEPADDKTFMVRALEFGDALSAVGRSADAQAWYQKVIARDDGKDGLEARVARERLAGGK